MRWRLGDDTTGTTDTTTDTTGGGGLLQNIVTAWGQFQAGKAQQSCIDSFNKANQQRMAMGQSPMQYDPSMCGQPGVTVGVSPQITNIVTIGVIGVLALMALRMVTK